MPTERLAIKITADGDNAEEDLESVKAELAQMAAVAEVADEQLDDVGTSAAAAGAGMGTFSALVQVANGNLAAFNALSLTTVGILGTLAAGVLGLGAAFGALAIGAVAAGGKELKQTFAKTRKEISKLVAGFGESFVPLLKTGIKSLPEFVKSLLEAIGPTQQFREFLSEAGAAIMEFAPPLVEIAVNIGRILLPAVEALLPVFEALAPVLQLVADALEIIGNVADRVGDLIEGIVGSLEKAIARMEEFVKKSEKLARKGFKKATNPQLSAEQRSKGILQFGLQSGIALGVGGASSAEDVVPGRQQPLRLGAELGNRGPSVIVRRIVANSRQEGREAAKGLDRELRSITGIPGPQR